MKLPNFGRFALTPCAAVAMLAGCGGAQSAVPFHASTALKMTRSALGGAGAGTRWPIQHVIVVVQRNRSFDNLFSGYPNANAPTAGLTSTGKRARLTLITLDHTGPCSDSQYGTYFKVAYRDGKMNGWNLLDSEDPLCPYTRVERSETLPYWSLAKEFSIADQMFSSTRFDDFVEQLYLIAGTTEIARDIFIAGSPDRQPPGCDAPPGTSTTLLRHGRLEVDRGPFPCFTFRTMANLLDDAHVTWRYYCSSPEESPFDAIEYVRFGRDWTLDISHPATNVLSDIAKGRLAAVSWVLSPAADSDLPGNAGGPRWVSSIAQAVRESRYWARTAIVVVWNEEGNGEFYDNVPPPQLDSMGLGFRVPMIVISPYARRGYVSHTEYEFGSILRFIEQNWKLPFLGGGATDRRANSIADAFEFP